jgi:hypothetical protein
MQQASHKQATKNSLSLLSTNLVRTVVFGTAMTILEIGISFLTLVERSEKALHGSIVREFRSEGHRDKTNERSHLTTGDQ